MKPHIELIAQLNKYHLPGCSYSIHVASKCECGIWKLQRLLKDEFEAERRAHLADVEVLRKRLEEKP